MEDRKYKYGEITSTSLSELPVHEIAYLLEVAIDNGNWHSPCVTDITIHTQHDKAVYGYCNISLHNNYNNAEHWFNINATSVNVWKEEYVRNRANKCTHRPIYNIRQLAELLQKITNTNTNGE